MRGETGLGWNEAEGKIEMDDTWSDRKLQMCERYLYFRNKDLRLFRDVYYSLFAGVSAIGARAWAPSSGPPPPCSWEPYRRDMYEVKEEEQIGDNNNPSPPPVPTDGAQTFVQPTPPPVVTSGMSYEGSTNRAKRSKTVSNATLKDDVHSIAKNLSAKCTGTAASYAFIPENCMEQSLDLLAALLGLERGSPLHMWAVTYLMRREARDTFLTLKDDELRIKWLEYVKNNPKTL